MSIFQFIENINLMKSTQHLLPIIMQNPVIKLSPLQANSYKLFYESSILAYTSARTLANKEIVKAAGVTAGKVTLGIPGMGRAKKIIMDYYMGK